MKRQEEELSYATNKKNTIKFKVVFVGDQNVGKSSIITRFLKNQFDSTHNPTVGIDFVSKNVFHNNKSIRLQLWDTAGQERFRSLIPGYLRDSNAALIIYDVTNRQSYNNVISWIDFIKENRGEDALIFVIGNKIDIQDEIAVDKSQADAKFKQLDMFHTVLSAKTGYNLEQVFKTICDQLLQMPNLETTVSLSKEDMKIIKNITAEKDKEKERPIQNSQNDRNVQKKQDIKGSKLIKSKHTGKIVKEKNCC